MLVVYMPIVRDAVHAYAELWNHHKIRKQPNRPNAVTSQPVILYHYPPSGVHSYEVLVNREYISRIEDSLQEWGMLYFLTPLFNSDCTIAITIYCISLPYFSIAIAQLHNCKVIA
jgi:hypothetical protein